MDDGARPLRRGTGPIGHTEDVPGAHVSARELSFEQKVACAWACTASFLQRWKYAFLLGCTTLDSTWHYPSAASTSMDLDDDTDDPSLLHYGLIAARHALQSTRSLDKVLRRNRPRYASTQMPTSPGTAPLFFADAADDRHFRCVFRIHQHLYDRILPRYETLSRMYSRRPDVKYGQPLPPCRQPPRISRRRLTPREELQVLLRYFATGCNQDELALQTGVSRSTIHLTIKFGLQLLLHALSDIPEARICLPDSVQECEELAAAARRKTDFVGLQNVIGTIDGSLFRLQRHYDDEEQERDYSGHKHIHARNVLLLWSNDGAVVSATIGRGSAHDSGILRAVLPKLAVIPGDYAFVGDSAFADSTHIKRMPRAEDAARARHPPEYWRDFKAIRVTAEQSNGLLKGMWKCLERKWQVHFADTKCTQVVTCCCMLHNILVRDYGTGAGGMFLRGLV